MDKLGLKDLLDLPLIALSNGQTRRARIARAVMKTPEVLLLDEPLSKSFFVFAYYFLVPLPQMFFHPFLASSPIPSFPPSCYPSYIEFLFPLVSTFPFTLR